MLFLMAADHQVEFAQNFLPKEAENLPIWWHISLKALTPELRKQVTEQLCMVGLAQCRQWLSGRHILGDLASMNAALSVLLVTCSSAGDTLEKEQQVAILGVAGQLWAVLQVEEVASQPYLQQTLCLLLLLLEIFIQMLEPQLLIQIFTLQTSLLQMNPPDHVNLASLEFLSSMGKPFIPLVIQGQILPKLAGLFVSLLASSTWLIHQHALEAFTQFAEETSHEDLVPQCLHSEETKNKVVCFLAKTRQVEETAKQEQALLKASLLKMEADGERNSALEPLAKRACRSPCERQYKAATETVAGALEAMRLLLQKGQPPAWLAGKLEDLQTALTVLKNSAKQS
uniref:Uncharacterized protein n=1 Tax=Sphenodon punctatus TaxID=8508 RepID=A0A8D0L8Y0_SPHPU